MSGCVLRWVFTFSGVEVVAEPSTGGQLDLFPLDVDLRRIDPSKNMRRFYSLSVRRGLFGEWCLERQWGRIGTSGRSLEQWFPDPAAAHDACLELRRRKARRGYRSVA
ncbi:WGR domain-containing protein [Amorphus sp. 3PC139-8]